MKKIILIALVAVLCVGTSYASKLEVTGGADFRGKTMHNYDLLEGDAVTQQNQYDFEMTLKTKFVVDENNFAFLRLEIMDDVVGTTNNAADDASADLDDNILVERAYLQTKIGPTALSAGLMDGGAWGTIFGDSTGGKWRIKAITTTPVGAVVAVIEKANENSTSTVDSQDNDVYYLGLVTKAGPMYIKPLVARADYNFAAAGSVDLDKTVFLLAANGTFGDISVEMEFGMEDVVYPDKQATDYSVMGFYANASMKMGDNTVGALLAWGGTDDTKGYSFGDDYDWGYIASTEKEIGGGGSSKAGMAGMTFIAAYGTFGVMENLSITPVVAYAMTNYDDASSPDSVDTAMEIDITTKYKINDAVTYKVQLCYASIALISGTDPDAVWLAAHTLSIAF